MKIPEKLWLKVCKLQEVLFFPPTGMKSRPRNTMERIDQMLQLDKHGKNGTSEIFIIYEKIINKEVKKKFKN